MAARRSSLAVVSGVIAALGALLYGCSDTDPNYGPTGAISRYTPDLGGTTQTKPQAEGGAGQDPKALFTAVYDATQNCAGCHKEGGAAASNPANIFYGANADASYVIFKKAGNEFHKAGSKFYNVGVHTGPALRADQKTTMDAWIAAEATGGGPTDAGGGG